MSKRKKAYGILKNSKQIETCFQKGKSFRKDGLVCKSLRLDSTKSRENHKIEILITASSKIKTKVKKNKIKRVIRAIMDILFEQIKSQKGVRSLAGAAPLAGVAPLAGEKIVLAIIGNENFIQKSHVDRLAALKYVLKRVNLS